MTQQRKNDRVEDLTYGVPSGVIVGRLSPGVGKGEFIPIATFLDQIKVSLNGAGPGTVTSIGFAVPASSIFGVSGSPITTAGTLTFTTTGTSGGVPYFFDGNTLKTSGALTANNPVIGGGAGAAPSSASRSGNTTTFATTTGTLTNGHTAAFDANGNIVDSGGTGGGSGTVTSVALAVPASSLFGVSGSPVTTTGTLTVTTTGTSGGIPYFSSTTQLNSSALLTAHAPVIGGGAGTAPLTTAALTNGQLLIGSTGADPVPASLTAGSNITITPGAGSITIAASGSGGGLGLFNQVMSATPTSSSTGLSTWANQGSATVTDATTGLVIYCPSNGSAQGLRIRYKAVPGSTPYTFTALVAVTGDQLAHYAQAGIGWYDGTKAQLFSVRQKGLSTDGFLNIDNFSNLNTYAGSSPFVGSSVAIIPSFAWLQIKDDGTNVFFNWSTDGASFLTLYTVAKSSGYLGSGGYTNVFFGINPYSSETYGALLSWTQT